MRASRRLRFSRASTNRLPSTRGVIVVIFRTVRSLVARGSHFSYGKDLRSRIIFAISKVIFARSGTFWNFGLLIVSSYDGGRLRAAARTSEVQLSAGATSGALEPAGQVPRLPR